MSTGATQVHEPRTARKAGRTPVLRTGRLVLAEDDPEMRRMVARALRDDGYEVVEARNGSELLECIDVSYRMRDPIDAVITDLRMPGLTGLQAIDWMQRVRGWRAPVILITAFGDTQTHLQARQLGAHVLDKPFDLVELRSLLATLKADRTTG